MRTGKKYRLYHPEGAEFKESFWRNQCWQCDGKGCKVCDNGVFVDKAWYLIYTDENGKKQAFLVDGLK